MLNHLKNSARLALIAFYAISSGCIYAQQSNEKEIIKATDFINPEYNKRVVKYMFKDSKNAFIKYNPVSLTLGGLMFFYQKFVSQALGTNCPYEVSCSAFSVNAIKRYGLIKGIALSADRLTRCNSISALDLTPENYHPKTQRILDPLEDYSK